MAEDSGDGQAKPSCFIIMPITRPVELEALYPDPAHFRNVLTHLHIPAVEQAGFMALPPIAEGADMIHAEIIRQLNEADLVLCDMSTHNPNVFFELGIRTALDKPVCMVKDTLTGRIPFDVGGINCEDYDPAPTWTRDAEVQRLATHVQASATRSEDRNTMWRVMGIAGRGELRGDEVPLEAKIDLLFDELAALRRERTDLGATPEALNRALRRLDIPALISALHEAEGEIEIATGKVISLALTPDRSGIVATIYSSFSTGEYAQTESLLRDWFPGTKVDFRLYDGKP